MTWRVGVEFLRRAVWGLRCFGDARGLSSKARLGVYMMQACLRRLGVPIRIAGELSIQLREFIFYFRPEAAELSPYAEVFLEGLYELPEGFKISGEERVVFDIGANIGLFTVKVASCLGDGVVYSFEPNAEVFVRLRKNVIANRLRNVVMLPVALSSRQGMMPFTFDRRGTPSGRIGVYPGGGQMIEVRAETLDGICESYGVSRVDFLKLDVEGHEGEVIRGAKRSLSQVSRIAMEYHGDKTLLLVTEELEHAGFIRVGVSRGYAYFANRELLTGRRNSEA